MPWYLWGRGSNASSGKRSTFLCLPYECSSTWSSTKFDFAVYPCRCGLGYNYCLHGICTLLIVYCVRHVLCRLWLNQPKDHIGEIRLGKGWGAPGIPYWGKTGLMLAFVWCFCVHSNTEPQKADKPVQPTKAEKLVSKPPTSPIESISG